MIDKIERYNLNGKELLYIKQNSKNSKNKSKTLYEVNNIKDIGKNVVRPAIRVSSRNNGRIISYQNYVNFDTVTAEKSIVKDTYSVSVPSKEGGKIIGYIKDNNPIAWTKDKSALKLLKKIGLIIKNGI